MVGSSFKVVERAWELKDRLVLGEENGDWGVDCGSWTGLSGGLWNGIGTGERKWWKGLKKKFFMKNEEDRKETKVYSAV